MNPAAGACCRIANRRVDIDTVFHQRTRFLAKPALHFLSTENIFCGAPALSEANVSLRA